MNDNDKTIDDIINMLDGFTSDNGSHMNIVVNDSNITEKKIEKANCRECSLGDLACQIPNLFEGTED